MALLGRAVVQAVTDPSQTIQDLTNNLKTLKQHFDSGTTLQAIFVSSKTLEAVEKLGWLGVFRYRTSRVDTSVPSS